MSLNKRKHNENYKFYPCSPKKDLLIVYNVRGEKNWPRKWSTGMKITISGREKKDTRYCQLLENLCIYGSQKWYAKEKPDS